MRGAFAIPSYIEKQYLYDIYNYLVNIYPKLKKLPSDYESQKEEYIMNQTSPISIQKVISDSTPKVEISEVKNNGIFNIDIQRAQRVSSKIIKDNSQNYIIPMCYIANELDCTEQLIKQYATKLNIDIKKAYDQFFNLAPALSGKDYISIINEFPEIKKHIECVTKANQWIETYNTLKSNTLKIKNIVAIELILMTPCFKNSFNKERLELLSISDLFNIIESSNTASEYELTKFEGVFKIFKSEIKA